MAFVHTLERTQFLPIPISAAWGFFSNPDNLKHLTPGYLRFIILSRSGTDRIFPGQIIRYRLRPILGIPVNWVTEITHVQEPAFFVDEQRFGPYAFWHHTHFFKVVPGGVEMRDLVHYKLPLGFLGRWANSVFVRRQLEGIFRFRNEFLQAKFPGSY